MSAHRLQGTGLLEAPGISLAVEYQIIVRDMPGGIPDAKGALTPVNKIDKIPSGIDLLTLRLEDGKTANISFVSHAPDAMAWAFQVQGVIA